MCINLLCWRGLFTRCLDFVVPIFLFGILWFKLHREKYTNTLSKFTAPFEFVPFFSSAFHDNIRAPHSRLGRQKLKIKWETLTRKFSAWNSILKANIFGCKQVNGHIKYFMDSLANVVLLCTNQMHVRVNSVQYLSVIAWIHIMMLCWGRRMLTGIAYNGHFSHCTVSANLYWKHHKYTHICDTYVVCSQ